MNTSPQSNENTDDAALLTRFRNRDKAAFDALYSRYAGGVFAFARRLTGTVEEAEDLTQETFVAAFRSAHGFRGNAHLLTWLLGIASRRCRDSRRTPKPQTSPLLEGEGEHILGATASVERAVVASVTLEAALSQLDEGLREAFLLVAAHGLTYKEAAHVLQAPVGTVKWRVSEAGRRLRVLLSDEAEPAPSPHETPARSSSVPASSTASTEVSHVSL